VPPVAPRIGCQAQCASNLTEAGIGNVFLTCPSIEVMGSKLQIGLPSDFILPLLRQCSLSSF
jgi:hypothetical protein